ncbi:MAG: DNA repair exonuclease [Pseudomonadota bacterium]|nr:DNA repair exonuclease [Pseudomonadota bacterium]
MIRFLHAADVHLDSPLVGLGQWGDAPVEEIRGATRRACENLVALAIKENASFVVIAGDLYDGDWKDYHTGIFLARQMARLKGAGIRVFIAAGNHDAASQITKSLQLPDNVHVFSTRKAESIPLPELKVVLHGRGFAERIVSDDVTRKYPPAWPGMFNIGVLHTSLTGREGHDAYAPCSVDGLRGRGYQYWALGHAHRHEVVARDPWIVYPGCLQGRHIRETGVKGCVVVGVEDEEVREVRHEPLDILRWSLVEVDAAGAADPREAIERAQRALAQEWDRHGGLPVIARLRITGETPVHASFRAHSEHWEAEFRAAAQGQGHGRLWLETVRFDTRPPAAATGREDDEAAAAILKELRLLVSDQGQVPGLMEEMGQLRQKLPPEMLSGDGDPDDPGRLADILAEARDFLEARLLRGGGPA